MKETKRRKLRSALTALLLGAVAVGVLALLTRLVTPKYMTDIVEGAMIAEYYDEVKDHDVIFIGDCELYENITPALLWEEYGINSYIRGSAQQLIWQSYYLLEDTLRYEKPKVVVFNVLSMQYNEPQKEAYNRMTLDGMRLSPTKIRAIKASLLPEEHLIEYLFPILRYHSRITELGSEDFQYLFHTDPVTYNGYYMRVDVRPAENIPPAKPLGDYRFGSNAYRYLDLLTQTCAAEGIELVLVKAPSLYPHWYDEWDAQMEDYAERHGLLYVNALEELEEIGLDFRTDTYDAGLHLNLSGAEKWTESLGELLTRECGLTSRRGEPDLEASWEEKLKRYYGDIESKKAEIAANAEERNDTEEP
ncbi:MAG: SGNH/GDSL hydrolase family protein [Lachnospiraceae bacterium]|nr:SGNH/GDSL hydrolase family protein [Lachnospiraceae bacterium]